MALLAQLSGEIVHGRGIGGKSGFPTANLETGTMAALPKTGVYASRMLIDDGLYAGITHIGLRPTVDQSMEPTIETFLFDYRGDLYGKAVSLFLYGFIRDTCKFADLAALKEQIDRDRKVAMDILQREASDPSSL